MAVGLFSASLCFGAQGDALQQSWIVNPSQNAAIQAILPEVHAVETTECEVIVRSAGLSLYSFGALEANAYEAPSGVRRFAYRFPRQPQPAAVRVPMPLGVIGALVTGKPLYNPVGTASYRDQNLWHRDAVAVAAQQGHQQGRSPLVEQLLSTSDRHSPIIGYALDGYPIYGPFGSDGKGGIRRMRPSYQLRRIARRDVWPDGTHLTPGQAGPDVSAEFPLGAFTEDFEYVAGSGDLDESNAKWAVTPEYPQGTNAYFLATDAQGEMTYPYLVGPLYRGQMTRPPAVAGAPKAGAPFEIRLDVRNQAGRVLVYLEKTHERPLHLLVVSEDLAEFAHIHPEPLAGGGFAVSHTFPHGGRYHLYADYSVPGEGPVVKHTTLLVTGPRRPAAVLPASGPWTQTMQGITAQVTMGSPIRSGVDLPLELALSDASTGQPVTDLEPFLGAWAHFVVVSADHEEFIHAHPLEEGEARVIRESDPHVHFAVSGPSPARIRTTVGFRRPGRYRMWAQFQRGGKGITIPLGLMVVPGAPQPVSSAIPKDAIRVKVSSAGFAPARIEVPKPGLVRLAFDRVDAQNCGGTVRFPELGITKELPPGRVTLLEFVIPAKGSLAFTCGMGMMRGAVVVRPAD